MNHKFIFPSLALLMFFTAGPGSLNAAVLFNDTFDTGATPSIADDIDDPTDTAWIPVFNVTPTIVNDTAGLGSGNALRGATSNVNLLVTSYATQTLASVGDQLSVSFDYRLYTGTAGARTPAFGLYTSRGGASVTDYTDDKGYNVQFATATQLRLQEDNDAVGDTDNILTGSSDTQIGVAQAYTTYTGNERRFSLSITRVADTNADTFDDLQLTYSLVDPTGTVTLLSYSFIDTSPISFSYDEFAIRSSAGYMIDNVTLEFIAVPEPSTYLLFGGGLTALFCLRNSRKKKC